MASEKKHRKHIDLLATVLALLLLVLASWKLLDVRDQLAMAASQYEANEERIARKEQENRTLTAALERAEDPEYLQELARENLGMVTPGQKDFYDVSN